MSQHDDLLLVAADDVHTEPHPSVGGYVLGGLGEETPAFVAHLGGCDACRAEVDGLMHVMVVLAQSLPPRRRDADVVDVTRVMRRLAVKPMQVFAAAAAVVLLLGGFAATRSRSKGIALSLSSGRPGASGTAAVTVDGSGSKVRLSVRSLPPLAKGEAYECWWTNGAGVDLSAGSFLVDSAGNADVILNVAANMRNAGRVRVTKEPNDGNAQASDGVILDANVGTSAR